MYPVYTTDAPQQHGPASQGASAGRLVCASGQIALDPETGEFVGGTVARQAMRALDNLQAVVEAAGLELSDVVQVTLYLRDMDDLAVVDAIYELKFPQPCPARTVVEVSRLPCDALIQLDCMAIR